MNQIPDDDGLHTWSISRLVPEVRGLRAAKMILEGVVSELREELDEADRCVGILKSENARLKSENARLKSILFDLLDAAVSISGPRNVSEILDRAAAALGKAREEEK